MPGLRSAAKSMRMGLFASALVALSYGPARAIETGAHPFVVLDRSIAQDQGDWEVLYRLRYEGAEVASLSAEDMTFRVEGWVSNSRASGHAVPRWSSQTGSGPSGMQATADVITSDDEEHRCRERAVVRLWTEDAEGKSTGGPTLVEGDAGPKMTAETSSGANADSTVAHLKLVPGTTFRIRLRLEHKHVVYGTYDPLLGTRSLELSLGSSKFRDVIPLDLEQRLALPPRAAFDVPEDRRDTQYFLSAPDSLHLAAHLPGNAFYRFPEIPVRHGTRMRLRFYYLIADGTQGTCRARITQYKDSPVAWKVLGKGRREEQLTNVGRWTRVERLILTEPDATTLALDFRIEGDDVVAGELWIDDVSLEPVGAPSLDP